MIYKFRSAAAGDVIMLGPHGDHLLSLLGREPAAKGIIEPAAMAGAISTLRAAVAADEAARAAVRGDAAPEAAAEPPADAVSLRQRVWPFVQLLEQSLAAGKPVVWGV